MLTVLASKQSTGGFRIVRRTSRTVGFVGAGLSLAKPPSCLPERQPKEKLGTGTSVCFICEDALALYREYKSHGIQMRQRPFVGNRLWVVPLTDPDGYRIDFESPTDAPEESELAE